jgi:hypothetical protein
MIPNLSFPAVDVRDVAKMHIMAMENASLKGVPCADTHNHSHSHSRTYDML